MTGMLDWRGHPRQVGRARSTGEGEREKAEGQDQLVRRLDLPRGPGRKVRSSYASPRLALDRRLAPSRSCRWLALEFRRWTTLERLVAVLSGARGPVTLRTCDARPSPTRTLFQRKTPPFPSHSEPTCRQPTVGVPPFQRTARRRRRAVAGMHDESYSAARRLDASFASLAVLVPVALFRL